MLSFASPACAACLRPACIIDKKTAEIPKLSASTAKATVIPRVEWEYSPITAPARAGPKNPTNCCDPDITELPACKSSSGTSEGTMLLAAGMTKPPSRPVIRPKTYNIQVCIRPVKISTATIADSTKLIQSHTKRIVRAEKRSVMAPPTSIKAARGIPPKASTTPSASGSPVSCRTSHGKAMNENCEPRIEVLPPSHNSRKSRIFSTRSMGLVVAVVMEFTSPK